MTQVQPSGAAKLDFSLGFNVFPLLPFQKKPAIDWKTYETQKASEDEIQAWFTGTQSNHAVVCGHISGGLVIQDLESQLDFEQFFPRWQELAQRTRVVTTPHGGVHVYWIAQEETPRRTKIFGGAHLVDILGTGGYACGAGSVLDHSLCDKKKCKSEGVSRYEVLGTYEVSLASAGLLESTLKRGQELGWQVGRTVHVGSTGGFPELFSKALELDENLRDLYAGDWQKWVPKSRSEAEFVLVLKLVTLGFPDQAIHEAMEECLIGKWREGGRQYQDLTIREARRTRAEGLLQKQAAKTKPKVDLNAKWG